MALFSDIKNYLSGMTSSITAKLSSFWGSTTRQSIWQGLLIPLYSLYPVQKIWYSSADVRRTQYLSLRQNAGLVLKALSLYYIYENYLYSESDQAYTSKLIGNIGAVYLFDQAAHIAVQTLFNTSTIVSAAAKARDSKPDFLESKESKPQQVCADIQAGVLYVIYNTATDMAIRQIQDTLPWQVGTMSALTLRSGVAGWSLFEYLLSLKGMGPNDRYQLAKSVWRYWFLAGMSHTLSYWSIIHFTGNNNWAANSGIAAVLYQVYILMILSRDEELPGQKNKGYDILALLKNWYKSPTFQAALKFIFLREWYSYEDFVKSPAVSNFLYVHRVDIRNLLETIKSALKKLESVEELVDWVKKRSPFEIVPEKWILILKHLGREKLIQALDKTEKLINVGIDIQYPEPTDYEYVESIMSSTENNISADQIDKKKDNDPSDNEFEMIDQETDEIEDEFEIIAIPSVIECRATFWGRKNKENSMNDSLLDRKNDVPAKAGVHSNR